MKHILLKKGLKSTLISLLFLVSINANAVVETYVGSLHKLKTFPLPGAIPMVSECYDNNRIPALPFNGYPMGWNNDFSFKYIKNSVSVSIDRSANAYVNTSSNFRIKIVLWAKDANGADIIGNAANTTPNVTLELKYNPANNVIEDDKALYAFENAVWFKATVVEISDFNNVIISPLGPNYPDIDFETKIEMDRVYPLDITSRLSPNFPLFSISVKPFGSPILGCVDKQAIEWANVSGAEEWEIEWQFLEYNNQWTNLPSIAWSNLINPPCTDIDFRNNATRVRINKFTSSSSGLLLSPYFEIPSIYESGYLVFRVRPIGRDINTFEEIYGPWSMNDKVSCFSLGVLNSNSMYVANYNEDLNWQRNVSFAEEGKYKHVISYFDGALRNRQSVTLNNTDNVPIVGQTFYDYVGRPTIQVLPTPALDNNTNSCFRPNFNTSSATNTGYNYLDFDLTANSICPSGIKVSEMSNSSGASQYYSPNGYNALTMPSWQAFVPDAQGYPFTQVEFTPDNTGRVARQSGVGPMHRLTGVDHNINSINGKETKYYYLKPTQNELYRLFGSEVGRAAHYKKNLVIDPNGQTSVSYIDPYGRTIATALAGDPNNTPSLTPLASSNQYFNDLSNNKSYSDIFNQSLSYDEVFYVTDANSSYNIKYEVIPAVFNPECSPEGVCFDCVYTLHLSLLDECGVNLIPEDKRFVNVGNINPFDVNCNSVSFNLTPNGGISLLLQKGSYRLSKTLTVNTDALEFYKQKYWENNNCLKTFEDFLDEENDKLAIKDKCIYTCVECEEELEQLNERKTELIAKGNNRTSEENTELEQMDGKITEQNKLCSELCKVPTPCEILIENILSDVTPNGQYALLMKYDEINNVSVSATEDDVNLLNDNQNRTWKNGCSWRTPLNPKIANSTNDDYYNEDGTLSLILVTENGPELVENGSYYNEDGTPWTGGANLRYIKPKDLKLLGDFVNYFKPSWAHSLKYYHPEYCYYEKCKSVENTYHFDNRMLMENDADKAKEKGYYNPLNNLDISNNNTNENITPYPYYSSENQSILDKEPFNPNLYHSDGTDYLVVKLREKLYNYSAYEKNIAGINVTFYKSIWDIYNDMKTAANLSSEDIECVGDPQWPLLRALYLSAKTEVLKDFYTNTNNCGDLNINCPTCNNSQQCVGTVTIETGKLARFPLDGNSLNSNLSFDPNNNANTFDDGKEFVDGKLVEFCTDKCESYISYWKTQLEKCDIYKNTWSETQREALITDLKKVCINGCDENNLLGSREVPLYRYSSLQSGDFESFYDVFVHHFGANNLTPGLCDELILEWPMDYGHDYAAYEGPYADTCACKKKDYATSNPNCVPNTIPDPLVDCACNIKNAEVRQAALMTLDIPDNLKCQNCVDCKTFNTGYSEFVLRYGKSTVDAMSDLQFQELMVKFMNLYLGFNLTYQDYLQFAADCHHVTPKPQPTRQLFSNFEKARYVKESKPQLPNFNQTEGNEMNLANTQIENLWDKIKTPAIQNTVKVDDNAINQTTIYPQTENDYLASNNNSIMLPEVSYITASTDAQNIACNCEKLLTAKWYTQNRNKDGLDDLTRYNQMFGNQPFGSQADFDKAYKVCCNIYNQNSPAISDCNNTNFKPGDKLTLKLDYIDVEILSGQNYPIITSDDYSILKDNVCTDPLEDDNKLERLDKCACEKLMDAKAKYINLYGLLMFQSGVGNPSFDAYIYQTIGVSGADFVKLTKRCEEFWQSGAGEDDNGVVRPWSGINSNWKKISLTNLKEDADDEDLMVPKKILCPQPQNQPEPCKHYTPGCSEIILALSEYLKNNPTPSGLNFNFDYAPSDNWFYSYMLYGGWENFYQTYMDHKENLSPDPAHTSFFNGFADFANNFSFIKKPCNTPANFSASFLIQKLKSCLPEPCRPDCQDFQNIFDNNIKQFCLNADPRPLNFDENTTLKDFYVLGKLNYYTDESTKQAIDNFTNQINAIMLNKCPKQNKNLKYDFSQIWNMMWRCFNWPNNSTEPPTVTKPPILPPKCQTCYTIDIDYLKNFENFLNKITKGNNTFSPNLNKLNYDDWKLINMPNVNVTEFYNSNLYLPNTSASQLRYRIDEDSYDVPFMEVEVKDNSGFVLGFTLEFPSDVDKYNYGYIKEFTKIRPLKRIGCGLPKSYEIVAEIIIPEAYPGKGTTEFIKMYGSFTKGGFAEFTDCWDTCVRLCNRPQIPAPKLDKDPCEQSLKRIAYSNALYRFEEYKKDINQKFDADYKEKCMSSVENFTTERSKREYHYTLYYYDQAGNLIKTVPPEGVDITNVYLTATQQQAFMDARCKQAEDHFTNPNTSPKANMYHSLITNYKYNTLNQLIWQKTPDGGESKFWYDDLGRIVVSQNAKQLANEAFSYTNFDALGRITEVGEKTTSNAMDYEIAANKNQLDAFMSSGTNKQVTRTYYDEDLGSHPANSLFENGYRKYLRHRVVSSHYFKNTPPSGSPAGFGSDAATHYSYDIHGNVEELIQEINGLGLSVSDAVEYKKMSYKYDLLSGKVNEVHYQNGQPDQFHHRYFYDADNRLTKTETSRDNWNYTLDAKYFYYLHGPLARTELGDYNQKVQGLDYAYTLHGWLKSVNAPTINPATEMGKDGNQLIPNNPNLSVARDAFGFMLHYYDGDYAPVGGLSSNFVPNITGSNLQAAKYDLFNGNIPFMQTSIPDPTAYAATGQVVNNTLGNVYRYDQLNRIVEHKVFDNFDNNTNTWLNSPMANGMGNYYETFSYDAMGNILTLSRNGNNAGPTNAMDNMTYRYQNTDLQMINMAYINSVGTNANFSAYIRPTESNKLYHVNESVSNSNYTDDIDDQGTYNANPNTINTANNYGYDEIGNLVRDNAEEIAEIKWNVYGKIQSITRTNGSSKADLEFGYDAAGQRLYKTVKPRTGGTLANQDKWVTTYYVRDATGNVMGTYSKTYTELVPNNQIKEEIKIKELHLYGSSRLGIYNVEITMATQEYNINGYNNTGEFNNPSPMFNSKVLTTMPALPTIYIVYKGKKQLELSNHLGNVLATITDRHIARDDNGDLITDYYNADISSTSDYYAFGSVMPGRSIGAYRYGFNNQEKDSELGDYYAFEYRIHDARLGRFFSIDPLFRKYPFLSLYQFAANQPIHAVELEGLESSNPLGYTQQSLTLNYGVSMSLGNFGSNISVGFSLSKNTGYFHTSFGSSFTLYNNLYGTGKLGGELIVAGKFGFESAKYSITTGTNVFKGSGELKEFNQRTGNLTVVLDKFSMSYENDGYFFAFRPENKKPRNWLADGMDRYRTAAVELRWDDKYSLGFNLFTGSRTNYDGDDEKVGKMVIGEKYGERNPNGYVNEDGTKYRFGSLYLSYMENVVGINSDRWVRHPIQDHFAHNFAGKPQPGFMSIRNKIDPYINISPSNLFIPKIANDNPIKKFTLWAQ